MKGECGKKAKIEALKVFVISGSKSILSRKLFNIQREFREVNELKVISFSLEILFLYFQMSYFRWQNKKRRIEKLPNLVLASLIRSLQNKSEKSKKIFILCFVTYFIFTLTFSKFSLRVLTVKYNQKHTEALVVWWCSSSSSSSSLLCSFLQEWKRTKAQKTFLFHSLKPPAKNTVFCEWTLNFI